MSIKTAIDLETLGTPDNDSEGYNCYISEKGIQALPSKNDNYLRRFLGEYQCKFFLCGKTYYVFDGFIVDENNETDTIMCLEFDENGIFKQRIISNGELLENYFSSADGEKTKTVSYMTLTDKKFSLFLLNSGTHLNLSAEKNILVVFSNNIIAIRNENEKDAKGIPMLTFIKNPVFAKGKEDDISELSALQVFSVRTFTPKPKHGFGDYENYDVEIENAEICGTCRIGDEITDLVLLEDDVFLYDRETEKIKALFQRRRRFAAETLSSIWGWNTNASASSSDYWPRSAYLHSSFTDKDNVVKYKFEYVNLVYFFDSDTLGVDLSDARTQFYNEWTGANDEKSINGTPLRITKLGETHSISIRHNVPQYPKTLIANKAGGEACVFISFSGSTEAYGVTLNGSASSTLYAINEVNVMSVDKETTVTQLKEQWARIAYKFDFLLDDRVEFRINQMQLPLAQRRFDAELRGTVYQYTMRKKTWAQMGRLFSIGTQVFNKRLLFSKGSNADGKISLQKFNRQDVLYNDYDYAKEININENVLAQFDDMHKIKGTIPNSGYAIYGLFDWNTVQEDTIEYSNAVYFSDVGAIYLETANFPYIVPSNVSDTIIGLYGEDRNLWTISQKSIEQFNISDAQSAPVQFVKLTQTYELLVDWSGINGRLDLLTKENSAFLFNGQARVKEIFSLQSRISPSTAIKGTRLAVIRGSGQFCHLIDAKNRAFKAGNDSSVFAITFKNLENTFADLDGNVFLAKIDDGNAKRFTVEWTCRIARNTVLRLIRIRMAQYDKAAGQAKRWLRLFRDGMFLRSRLTNHQTVEFFKIAHSPNTRLKLEMEGYLKEIEIEDSERGQK